MGYQFLRSAPEDVGVDTASLVLFLERIKSGDFDATTMLLMRHNQIFLQY